MEYDLAQNKSRIEHLRKETEVNSITIEKLNAVSII